LLADYIPSPPEDAFLNIADDLAYRRGARNGATTQESPSRESSRRVMNGRITRKTYNRNFEFSNIVRMNLQGRRGFE